MQLDLASGGECHELAQVVVGAHEVSDEVDLGRDHVDGEDDEVLAVADHVVIAGSAEHPSSVGGAAALADEVDDHIGLVAAAQLEYLFHLTAFGDDAVVGPDGHSELDRVGVAVDDDQLGGRDRLQHLDSDVPEPARSDDHAAIAGPEPARRLGGGVVRGEPGVGERCHVGGLERVVDPDNTACGGFEVLGVATRGVNAREL